MTKTQITNAINELRGFDGGRLAKYTRSYQLYEATPNLSLNNIKDSTTVGWITHQYDSYTDTSSDFSLNVIKSCVDGLTAKIASQKVRPFFNTIKGSYKDVKRAKCAQQYFDVVFEELNINKEVEEAFKNSCIFDTGILFIDTDNQNIKSILPWQVYTRPSEATYKKLTRIYYERKQYPKTLIREDINWANKAHDEYVTYGLYFDVKNHVKTIVINNIVVKTEEYKPDVLPFVFIHYSNPIKGNSSSSIADMLAPIQVEIDILSSKIKAASQLNPANTIFVPSGSDLSAHKLNNGIGNLIQYRPSANMTGSPITVATPPFIDGQYQALIKDLKEQACDMVGISELSLAGNKPAGLDSGKALSSLENIEGARFEVQLNEVIRAYVDLARVCINLFSGQVLPTDRSRKPITWEEVRESINNFSIQFSGQNAFSKDPSTKEQQVLNLWKSGFLRGDLASTILDLPDTEKAYSLMQNSYNAVQQVIENVIENNVYETPAFVPFDLLKSEILNTQLQLYSADPFNNKNDILKLSKLYEVVVTQAKQLQQLNMQITQTQMEEANGL